MRGSRLRRALRSDRLITAGLIATVMTFVVVSVAVVLLNDRAGGRAVEASQTADAYEALQIAVLEEEVARHHLLLDGGPPAELQASLLQTDAAWARILSTGDSDGDHAAAVRALGAAVRGYQSTVRRSATESAKTSAAADDAGADVAADQIVEQLAAESSEHRQEAADVLSSMRARQQFGARAFPVVGALSLALVGLAVQRLGAQRRRMARTREDAQKRAVTDELTGLMNRAGLRAVLHSALSAVPQPQPLALLLLDLDGFKEVNDTFGHELGDQVLQLVAGRLLQTAPPPALVARLGGDEFVVLLPDADQRGAQAAAWSIRAALSRPAIVSAVLTDISASIGVALSSGLVVDAAVEASDLLRRADVAMYASKTAKTGPVLFTELPRTAAARSMPRQT